jgi:hypothetical protein
MSGRRHVPQESSTLKDYCVIEACMGVLQVIIHDSEELRHAIASNCSSEDC